MPQNTFEAFLAGIAFTIPFDSISLSGVMIICLGVVWLISEKDFSKKQYTPILWGFALYYGIHILRLANSTNIDSALSILEKKLSLLLLPVFLLTSKHYNQKTSPYILGSFVLATFIQAIYALANVLLLTSAEWAAFHGYTGKDYRLAFVEFLGIHPTSFSIFIFLSIFIIMSYVWKGNPGFVKKIAGYGLILFLIIIALFLVSRTPLAIFIVLSAIGLLYYFYQKGKFWQGMFYIVAFTLLVGFIGYQTPSIRYRFEELKNMEYAPPTGLNHTSSNIRVGLFICSMEVLQENWLTGTGLGDLQTALNQCYQNKNYSDILYMEDYNPHNQYLQTILALGVLGLFSFLGLQFLLLKHAFQYRNYVHAAFVIFMLWCFLTDSFLEVNKGIVLYSFFNAFFARDNSTQALSS